MKKLAIIGASDLQVPLIQKAHDKGIETHVFAWEDGATGRTIADYFYPISIVEKDDILSICRKVGVDGVASIASDLATITVDYIANAMGLVGNSPACTLRSTNKHAMREAFESQGDPSPKSRLVMSAVDCDISELKFPIIVKPTDRSGSRGITKLETADGLGDAIELALSQSFEKKALVEEFAEGDEYSVEFISWEGSHHFLALTHKVTTGAPHFIEVAHFEPAFVAAKITENVKTVVTHALETLGVEYGASHSEVKIDDDGNITIIEIGSRMGGDCIGSSLVDLSTGVDFTAAVIDVALGNAPDLAPRHARGCAAVRYILCKEDLHLLEYIRAAHPDFLVFESDIAPITHDVADSSMRFGFFVLRADTLGELEECLGLKH